MSKSEFVMVKRSDLEDIEKTRIEICDLIEHHRYSELMYLTESLWKITHRKVKGGLHEPDDA